MIREHDRVVLTAPVPNERLEIGDVGTVVHVYSDGKAFEVEFTTLDAEQPLWRRSRSRRFDPSRAWRSPTPASWRLADATDAAVFGPPFTSTFSKLSTAHGGLSARHLAREALIDRLEAISRTARSIAVDTADITNVNGFDRTLSSEPRTSDCDDEL